MKISVSLPESDIAFVDEYAAKSTAESRSAVIHAAIELLRASQMEGEYAAAWDEWDSGDDAHLWEHTTADGLTDAAR
jgi:Arc/MetJ-type ribon-helix-helix transcriptional regulator